MATCHSSDSSASTSSNQDAPSFEVRSAVPISCRPGGGRIMFPMRLYIMLEDLEVNGYSHVISWQPHGRCFVVHKQHDFVSRIAPTYFRQSKWSSFQRQLNIYGFNRLTDGLDKGGYYHPSFLRGYSSLCNLITRTTVKGTRCRVASNPNLEPDFYSMSSLDSTPPDVALGAPRTSLDKKTSYLMQKCTRSVSLDSECGARDLICQNHVPQQQYGDPVIIQHQSSLGAVVSQVSQDYDNDHKETAITFPCHNMAQTTFPSQCSIGILDLNDPIACLPQSIGVVMSEVSQGYPTSWMQEKPITFICHSMAHQAWSKGTPANFLPLQQGGRDVHEQFQGQSQSTVSHPNPVPDDILDDNWMISDDPGCLQRLFAVIGKSFSFDELDELPEDDQDWGDLLETYAWL